MKGRRRNNLIVQRIDVSDIRDLIRFLTVRPDINPSDIMDMKRVTKLVIYCSKPVASKELPAFSDNGLEIRIQLV